MTRECKSGKGELNHTVPLVSLHLHTFQCLLLIKVNLEIESNKKEQEPNSPPRNPTHTYARAHTHT